MRPRKRPVSPLGLFVLVVVVFILLPLIAVIGSSFTSAFFVSFPPKGFSLRWYAELLNHPDYVSALRTSALVGILTSVIATTIGTAAALAIAKHQFWGRNLLSTFFMAPLMLPHVVIGIALLTSLNGLGLPPTVFGIVFGHTLIATPFVIRLVGASMANLDDNLTRAARVLGASPLRALLRVTLPLAKNGIVAGGAFAAIVSLNDVDVAVFMQSPTTMTLPVQVYSTVEQAYTPLVPAVSSVSIIVVVLLMGVALKALGLRAVHDVR